jgi:hypothetical protein
VLGRQHGAHERVRGHRPGLLRGRRDAGLGRLLLAKAATAHEAREVRQLGAVTGYSSSRTCEVNLARETGITYRSIVFLVEQATRRGAETPGS